MVADVYHVVAPPLPGPLSMQSVARAVSRAVPLSLTPTKRLTPRLDLAFFMVAVSFNSNDFPEPGSTTDSDPDLAYFSADHTRSIST